MSRAVIIPAISLWQPWASLWILGVKIHETRDWPFPEKYEGVRIGVQAAKKRIPNGDLGEELHVLCLGTFGVNYFAHMPFGCMLGTIELVKAKKGFVPKNEDDRICGFFGPERWAWQAREPIAFPRPIPTMGRQGFFKWERPA